MLWASCSRKANSTIAALSYNLLSGPFLASRQVGGEVVVKSESAPCVGVGGASLPVPTCCVLRLRLRLARSCAGGKRNGGRCAEYYMYAVAIINALGWYDGSTAPWRSTSGSNNSPTLEISDLGICIAIQADI